MGVYTFRPHQNVAPVARNRIRALNFSSPTPQLLSHHGRCKNIQYQNNLAGPYTLLDTGLLRRQQSAQTFHLYFIFSFTVNRSTLTAQRASRFGINRKIDFNDLLTRHVKHCWHHNNSKLISSTFILLKANQSSSQKFL